MFKYTDCVKANLLRRNPASKEKAKGSIKAAKKWLDEAEKDLKGEAFNSSLMSAYIAMFHSSRAILFFDGFREKSHYCIARYLEEKYVKKNLLENKWIELLDHYREQRHDDQYDINFLVTQKEAETALTTAKSFVGIMNKLLNTLH